MYGYIYLYEKFVANRQIIVDSIILYKYIYIYIYRRANSMYNDTTQYHHHHVAAATAGLIIRL